MTHGKRTLLIIAAAVVVDFGLTFAIEFFDRPYAEKIGVSLGMGVVLIVLTCWWASYDGAERNIRPPYAHMIVLYITGLPYYLFRSRGFIKGLVASIIAVAIWTVPSSLGAHVGWYAARYGTLASTEWKQCFNGTTHHGIIPTARPSLHRRKIREPAAMPSADARSPIIIARSMRTRWQITFKPLRSTPFNPADSSDCA